MFVRRSTNLSLELYEL
uniref:Uncharacterized protein n=1 Tax=Arundo donax TaxID=35708 RepID=A0A0A8XZT9_ARUDO